MVSWTGVTIRSLRFVFAGSESMNVHIHYNYTCALALADIF